MRRERVRLAFPSRRPCVRPLRPGYLAWHLDRKGSRMTDDNDTTDRAKDALDRDWEQTKSDLPGLEGKDLDQDVDDTVKQAAGKEPVPGDKTPNRD